MSAAGMAIMLGIRKSDRSYWSGVAILSVLLHTMLLAFHSGLAGGAYAAAGSGGAETSLICAGSEIRERLPIGEVQDSAPANGIPAYTCPACIAVCASISVPDIAELPAFTPACMVMRASPTAEGPRRVDMPFQHPPRGPPPLHFI